MPINSIYKQLNFHYSPNKTARSEQAFYFIFNGNNLLRSINGNASEAISHQEWISLNYKNLSVYYIGSMENIPCYAVAYPEEKINEDFIWVNLRTIMAGNDSQLFAIAGRAKQILEFIHTHQYCGICGFETRLYPDQIAKECIKCSKIVYPRLSPCVIVLITDKERILLAQGRYTPGEFYTTLAGHVEPGETLEQTVHREILEEVGIEVTNLKYFSSQAWPFPHNIMIGFFAEYQSGEICIDNNEILDARWWHYTELPSLPPQGAISRALIDSYMEQLN